MRRLIEAKIALDGASDHGVSEELYLRDPDDNGVELYWHRPKDAWPFTADDKLAMFTHRLDLMNLLAENDSTPRYSSHRVIRNRLRTFPRRLRMNRQRVHAALELARQRCVNHAVALDPALSAEGFRHDIKSEMGFAARPVSGMALVVMGFILDAQALRRESCRQLCRNNIVHSHDAWLSA